MTIFTRYKYIFELLLIFKIKYIFKKRIFIYSNNYFKLLFIY